jgi:PPOX class probable FMN-dependent enzyme
VLAGQCKPQLKFHDVITTEQELRATVGKTSVWFQSKILTKLDVHCRRFIARSPFVVVGSACAEGRIDTSPKGDEPGFVRVLDDVTLALPDRAGNRRFDTFQNLLQNPNIALIFFIPGRRDTLRIGGKALIVRDLALRQSMAAKGRVPHLVTVVSLERAYFHCGSCIARSKLWEAVSRPMKTGEAANDPGPECRPVDVERTT